VEREKNLVGKLQEESVHFGRLHIDVTFIYKRNLKAATLPPCKP
jgi:hypothetical protein